LRGILKWGSKTSLMTLPSAKHFFEGIIFHSIGVLCYANGGRIETMELNITIELRKKGNWYLARTPELDFISQGRTREEAKKNLLEVAKIQFTEMKEMGTLEDYLLECGFETKENDIIPRAEMVEFEKSVVSV
jgi:predicted RNase H-like HicB family nuclease